MTRLFDPENRFWNFLSKIADVFCISILWMVCSLPVFTFGAATGALYSFTLHQVYDAEDSVLHGFFTAFGKNFKKSTAIWGIQLGLGLFLTLDCFLAWQYFIRSENVLAVVVLAVVGCVTLMYIMASTYLYPLLATFDFSIKKLIRDSVILSIANLFQTAAILLIWVIAAVMVYFFSGMFFVFVGLAAFFSSYFIRAVFLKYTVETADKE